MSWLLKGTSHILADDEVQNFRRTRTKLEFSCAICDKSLESGDIVRSLYTNNKEDKLIS